MKSGLWKLRGSILDPNAQNLSKKITLNAIKPIKQTPVLSLVMFTLDT
jgi:hypothetical protein